VNRSTLVYAGSLFEIAVATDILSQAWSRSSYLVLPIPIGLALIGTVAASGGMRPAVIANVGFSALLLLWRVDHTHNVTARDFIGVTIFAFTAFVLTGLALSRRRIEAELVHKQRETQEALAREAELVRTKDDFLSMVAHELRNPVAIIIGYADLLGRKRVARSRHEEIERDLSAECRRLHELIEDLLAIGRIDAGLAPQPEPILVRRLVDKVTSEFEDRHSNPLHLDVQPDLPLASGSEAQVERVLANVLDNAAKYSPESSEIRVEARYVAGRIQIDVLDSGQGVPDGMEDLIFGRFYRGEAVEEGRGYGLGLAISRRLIEGNGGRIWAQNRDEGGLQVSFSLDALE
jgi:signal transduction histidine kinase